MSAAVIAPTVERHLPTPSVERHYRTQRGFLRAFNRYRSIVLAWYGTDREWVLVLRKAIAP
jgi:hypothetical protein